MKTHVTKEILGALRLNLSLSLFIYLATLLSFLSPFSAKADRGAVVPWTTYEAESMTINGGTLLGPPAIPANKNIFVTNTVEMESSQRQCVKLSATGHYVQFSADAIANTLVVRYSIPDSGGGGGLDSTISLYVNGSFVRKIPVTSKYSWLYGNYPFSNLPSDNRPRNFYDEARLSGLTINPGDLVRLQKDADDSATYYVIDLVDLEKIGLALSAPGGSRSVLTYGAVGNGTNDDTAAIINCINAGSGTVWVPTGNYLLTSDLNVPANVTIQGAGMWYTTFVGNPSLYGNSNDRVRINGGGNNIHLNDFAIVGKLNYRGDSEPNDGIGDRFGTGSTISRIWVEHTKVGAWIVNSSNLVVEGCRFRNTIADGINLSVGMRNCIVTNCTARGVGDDCFAIWPATYLTALFTPGLNLITRCTGQVPFLANGGAIYGATNNRIEECVFQDIPCGAGILISGTFDVGGNTFKGTTTAQRCDLIRCGGFDPGFRWRGALTLCPDNNDIRGVEVNDLNISNSLSHAIQNISRNGDTLSNAVIRNIEVTGYGTAVPVFNPPIPAPGDGAYGMLAFTNARGSLTVSNLTINGALVASTLTPGPTFTNQSSQFTFIFHASPQNILETIANPDGSFTIKYAAIPGIPYHLESSTNLALTNWTTVAGSTTNSTTNIVTFTDANAIGTELRYYRSVTP